MDSAQKTLIEIASVSQQVVNTLDRHVGCKTVESFWLDKIVIGARTILEVLTKTLLLKGGNADDRLVDWLNSEEPQACLRTLKQMEEILNRRVEYGVKSLFKASRSMQTQDKNGEAIRLFQMRKSYFHFLLTTGIWNRESGPQPDALHVKQALDGRGLATVTQYNSSNPSDIEQARKMSMIDGKQEVTLGKLDGILGWLDAWNSRRTHERTTLLRQPDTCTWLPNTSAFKQWRNGGDSFLWLHGKPGAGKSVLAAFVIEGLKDTPRDGEVLAYFYCDFRDGRSTSAAEVMRSLLSQLLRQFRRHAVDPGDSIDELVEERDGGASTINNVTLLARHVSRAAKQFQEPPFLVIDAMDECKNVEELLDGLVKLQEGGVRLLAISRPLQIIKEKLSGVPFIDMEAMGYKILAEVRLHVTRELDSHRRLRIMDASLKEEIYSALCKKAGGMFRWVQCQLNTLKECMTASDIREALNDLPSDLDATYGRILLGIDRAKRESKIARRALDWLVVALKPLQLSQIMEGISIDLARRTVDHDSRPVHGAALLDALGSLVIYDEAIDIVMVSHFSVKEYLTAESTRKKYPGYHVDERAAHTQMALLCLYYVGIYLRDHQESDDDKASPHDTHKLRIRRDNPDTTASHSKKHPGPSLQSFESHPLLQYVLSVGFRHLTHVNPRNRAVLCAIEDFQLDARQHPLEWRQLCERVNPDLISHLSVEHDLALYILIGFAPEPLLRSFIGHTRLQPKEGTNPLIYAAYCDKIEHARTLLSRGTNPNHRGLAVWNSTQVLPLEVAVLRSDRAMVDLFLDNGSHVPHGLFMELLQERGIPTSAHIVSRLLQTDDFAEWVADVCDQSIFSRALDDRRYYLPDRKPSEKDIDIIQRRLVQIGHNPPARFDEASLRYAVSAGHVSTVKHMLSLDIPFPPDIILDASRSQNSTMICLFLDIGFEVDVTSPIGNTPMHLVLSMDRLSEDDCFESVHVLVDAGCNPSTCNLAGRTPLHIVARHGYISVVEYFLALGAPLPPDILLEASQSAMIRSLIRQGADVHAIAANGNTPLHLVLRHSRIDSDESLECAEILVNAGCSPFLPNALGETALDVAAKYGLLPVLQSLLSMKVPMLPPSVLLSAANSYSSTATSVIKLLIDNGADTRATRPSGDTPLHLVYLDIQSEADCLKRVKILVNAGCDPRACNLAGRTPFHFAARQRYVMVMEYLLSLGVSVPSDVMLTQFESFFVPVPLGYYSATRFLLDNGGDIHTISKSGNTLLHLAAEFEPEHDALEFSKLFVHAGCKLSIPNSELETPIHIAARKGYISVIDYFLALGVSLPPDILLAASVGYSKKTEVIRYLVEKGADVSAVTTDGDTPLHLSVITNSQDDWLESVKILIDAGCDPRAQNSNDETPMHTAARHGSISVLEYFLSQGVPLPGDILLTSAPSTIRFLVGKGVDVRCVASNVDMQLMHRALDYDDEEDYLECAKILVAAGWNPLLRNSAGETPIHVAVRHGQLSTIKYLHSHSDNAPLPSDILLPAVPKGIFWDEDYRVTSLYNFLIREGASVNATTSNGDTPLHLILRSEHILSEHGDDQMDIWKAVEILLNYGADPSARNVDGQRPIDIAEANGHFFKGNFLRLVRNAHRAQSSS